MARPNTAAVRLLAGDREPVLVATTANITLSGLQTIDGVMIIAGDRVLAKDQTDATENGIYEASAGTWYRAADARSTRAINKGVKVAVQSGTVNSGRVYAQQTLNPDIGDDDIDWELYLSDDAAADLLALAATLLQQISEAGGGLLDSVVNPVFANKTAAEAYDPDTAPGYIDLKGYYAAGDGGGETYKKVGSEPSHGGKFQIAEGSWYEIAPAGEINVKSFGAKGDNTQNEKTYFDAAIAFAAGRTIYAPAGGAGYRFDAVLAPYAGVVNIRGDGHGQTTSPGTIYNTLGTTFLLNFTSGSLFAIDHAAPVTFRNILFRGINLPMVAGGPLYFTASGGGLGCSPIIENCAFALVYRPIHIHKPSDPFIGGRCIFNQWIDSAIFLDADGVFESGGGEISTNDFIGYISGTYGIKAECGYPKISNNRIVGLPVAFALISTGGSAGGFEAFDNQIEEQTTHSIEVVRTGVADFASMLQIRGNEFSNIVNTGLTSHIQVFDSAGADWIDTIIINDNIFRSTLGNSSAYIIIASGTDITCDGNKIHHFGPGTAVGISCKGAAVKVPAMVRNNTFHGLVGTRYDTSTAVTIFDLQGMTYAVANAIVCADGSMFYVTDGAPHANPLTAASTGAIAKKLNGILRSD